MTIEKTIDKTSNDTIDTIYKDLNDGLDKVEKEEVQVKQKKKDMILNAVTRLEAIKYLEGKSIDNICTEISKVTNGKVSSRYVRKCLPKKYKQKSRVNNANKQKRYSNPSDLRNSAELVPLDQQDKNIETVKINSKGEISLQEENNTKSKPIRDVSLMDPDLVKNNRSLIHLPPPEMTQLKNEMIADWSDCQECKRKDILLLQDKQEKDSQKKQIEKLKNMVSEYIKLSRSAELKNKVQNEETLVIRYRISKQELNEYISHSQHLKSENDGISVKIVVNKSTGDIVSSSFV